MGRYAEVPRQLVGLWLLALFLVLTSCEGSASTAPNPPDLPDYNGGPKAHLEGSFAPVQDWPLIAVHAVLLPSGKVLTWSTADRDGAGRIEPPSSSNNNRTNADLWDPATNQHTDVSRPGELQHNLFCSGMTVTADGQAFMAGGHAGADGIGIRYYGSRTTYTFDPTRNAWTRKADMAGGRWYPSLLTLADGQILAVGGQSDNPNFAQRNNPIPEVWSPQSQSWRPLTGASSAAFDAQDLDYFDHLYPMMHLAPDGTPVNVGPGTQMRSLQVAGTGQWSAPKTRDDTFRYEGTSTMFAPGKVLVVGGSSGSLGYGVGGVSQKTAVVVDLNNMSVTSVKPMNFARAYHNATLLPDGSIFVNGGNTSGQQFDNQTVVMQSETYYPERDEWRLGAVAKVPREYHSIALLLPDGRVLTAGGGMCGDCLGKPQINHFNAEIYYPPYLFKKDGSGQLAPRPVIQRAPDKLSYGQSFSLEVSSTLPLRKAVLIRSAAVTHATSFDNRIVPLVGKATGNTFQLTAPASPNLAPPGYYLLFVLDEAGVPSVARLVRVS